MFCRDMFPSHVKVYVQNDAIVALASGTMGKLHGCVLIAGTGCIAYGFDEDGKEARASGGGPILGDWGRYFSSHVVVYVNINSTINEKKITSQCLCFCILLSSEVCFITGSILPGRN